MNELMLLLVGAVLGALIAGAMVMRRPELAARMGFAHVHPRAMADDLEAIRKEDKELAARIEAPPAVDPAEVPFVVDEALQRSPDFQKVVARVYHSTLRETLLGLHGWRPRSRSGDERGYVNSMLHYLKRNDIKGMDIEREKRITWADGARWAKPDVIVKQRVLVEVKADLDSSSASDRSMGQMLRYLLAWKDRGPAILVVCGQCDSVTQLLTKDNIRSWRESLKLPVTVWFVREECASEVERGMPEDALS
jgi:hypothetical protein